MSIQVTKDDCRRDVIHSDKRRVDVTYSLFTQPSPPDSPEPKVIPALTEPYTPDQLAQRRQAAEIERELLEPGNWSQERVGRLAALAIEDAFLDEVEAVMNTPIK